MMSSEEVIKPMPPPLTGFKAHWLTRGSRRVVQRRSQRKRKRTVERFRFNTATAHC